MRLLCFWGRTHPTTIEPGPARSHFTTLRGSGAAHEAIVHLGADGRQKQLFHQCLNGSLIVVDGEIYSDHGHLSPAALEDLLEALTAERRATLAELDSAAAILTWDARTEELCVSRDRYGLAQVFYACSGEGVIVAGDFASVLESRIDVNFDFQALDCFIARGFLPSPLTFFREVRKLGPAEMLRIRPGEDLRIESYFHPTARTPIRLPLRDRLHGTKTRLMNAVDRRQAQKARTGILLSSGIDSALVLAATRELGGVPDAFTFHYAAYSGPFNEGTEARRLADHFHVHHHLIECRPQHLIEALPHIAESYGEPLTYGLHSFMTGALERHGISVALTGVGADCFGISDSGFAAIGFYHLPARVRAAARAAIEAAARIAPHMAKRFYALLWADRHALPSCVHPALTSDELRAELFNDKAEARFANARTIDVLRVIADSFAAEHPIASWRFTGQRCFAAEGALFWNRVWSRAAGLTLRHPFFDNELQEFMMRVGRPGRGKLYLRELAAEMLPPWAARRPKLHHTIPIGHWFRGPLRELLEDYLSAPVLEDYFDLKAVLRLKDEHLSTRADHSWRLWALVSFVAWHTYVLKPARAAARLAPLRAPVTPASVDIAALTSEKQQLSG